MAALAHHAPIIYPAEWIMAAALVATAAVVGWVTRRPR